MPQCKRGSTAKPGRGKKKAEDAEVIPSKKTKTSGEPKKKGKKVESVSKKTVPKKTTDSGKAKAKEAQDLTKGKKVSTAKPKPKAVPKPKPAPRKVQKRRIIESSSSESEEEDKNQNRITTTTKRIPQTKALSGKGSKVKQSQVKKDAKSPIVSTKWKTKAAKTSFLAHPKVYPKRDRKPDPVYKAAAAKSPKKPLKSNCKNKKVTFEVSSKSAKVVALKKVSLKSVIASKARKCKGEKKKSGTIMVKNAKSMHVENNNARRVSTKCVNVQKTGNKLKVHKAKPVVLKPSRGKVQKNDKTRKLVRKIDKSTQASIMLPGFILPAPIPASLVTAPASKPIPISKKRQKSKKGCPLVPQLHRTQPPNFGSPLFRMPLMMMPSSSPMNNPNMLTSSNLPWNNTMMPGPFPVGSALAVKKGKGKRKNGNVGNSSSNIPTMNNTNMLTSSNLPWNNPMMPGPSPVGSALAVKKGKGKRKNGNVGNTSSNIPTMNNTNMLTGLNLPWNNPMMPGPSPVGSALAVKKGKGKRKNGNVGNTSSNISTMNNPTMLTSLNLPWNNPMMPGPSPVGSALAVKKGKGKRKNGNVGNTSSNIPTMNNTTMLTGLNLPWNNPMMPDPSPVGSALVVKKGKGKRKNGNVGNTSSNIPTMNNPNMLTSSNLPWNNPMMPGPSPVGSALAVKKGKGKRKNGNVGNTSSNIPTMNNPNMLTSSNLPWNNPMMPGPSPVGSALAVKKGKGKRKNGKVGNTSSNIPTMNNTNMLTGSNLPWNNPMMPGPPLRSIPLKQTMGPPPISGIFGGSQVPFTGSLSAIATNYTPIFSGTQTKTPAVPQTLRRGRSQSKLSGPQLLSSQTPVTGSSLFGSTSSNMVSMNNPNMLPSYQPPFSSIFGGSHYPFTGTSSGIASNYSPNFNGNQTMTPAVPQTLRRGRSQSKLSGPQLLSSQTPVTGSSLSGSTFSTIPSYLLSMKMDPNKADMTIATTAAGDTALNSNQTNMAIATTAGMGLSTGHSTLNSTISGLDLATLVPKPISFLGTYFPPASTTSGSMIGGGMHPFTSPLTSLTPISTSPSLPFPLLCPPATNSVEPAETVTSEATSSSTQEEEPEDSEEEEVVVAAPAKKATNASKTTDKKSLSEEAKQSFRDVHSKAQAGDKLTVADFNVFTVNELKLALKLNDRSMTGNKTDLSEKLVDNITNGCPPRCPSCGGGRLKVREKGAGEEYYCSGYMEDDEFINCCYTADWVARIPWKSP